MGLSLALVAMPGAGKTTVGRLLAKQLHLPAQSGSSAVLQAMRRGYTREAYAALAQRVREVIPGVAISSDFIAGFCGEVRRWRAAIGWYALAK